MHHYHTLDRVFQLVAAADLLAVEGGVYCSEGRRKPSVATGGNIFINSWPTYRSVFM